MIWRYRCIFSGHFELPEGASIIRWKASIHRLMQSENGSNTFVIDFMINAANASDAYYAGLAKSIRVADFLAYMSLARVNTQPISATKPYVKINESFEIAIDEIDEWQTPAALSVDACAEMPIEESLETNDLRRGLREALATKNPLHAYSMLWSAMEPLLESFAIKNKLISPVVKCRNCGEKTGGELPSTQDALQFIINTLPVDEHNNRSNLTAKKLRSIRGKIVHGSDLGDEGFRTEVENALPVLLSAGATALGMLDDIKTCFSSRVTSYPNISQFNMLYGPIRRGQAVVYGLFLD
jgi:hypothetical protein